VKPAPFSYHAPASAKEAVELLAELGDGAKVIAGGQSLIPMLALRLAVFEHLIDIRDVPGVRGISGRGAAVWVGAGTTQAAIGRSGLIAAKVPLLARATPLIGHFQIRNRGTIGGSLAHAEAAAEYPAVALTLDAVIETTSPRGDRAIPASEFFTGIWTTALEPDELLTGVAFRVPGARAGFAIEEFSRRPGDFAVAGAAIAIELDGGNELDPRDPRSPQDPRNPKHLRGPQNLRGPQGSQDLQNPPDGRDPRDPPGKRDARVSRCAIGLFGLGPTPLRAAAAEASIVGSPASDLTADARAREIGRAAMADLDSVPSDLHGPAAYRKRVGAALVATAWQRAIREARGEEADSG
jgi:carbon-monoxide dehydrogenase medium subunit